MTIALPQITDAQLTELGWTAGQIKEVRKYLKLHGFERNAHQRGLCRRYSEAQRLVTPVTVEPRFTGGKAPKAKKAKAPRQRTSGDSLNWTADQLQLMVDLYIQHVDPFNQEDNREVITDTFLDRYPERNSSGVKMVIMQIKAHDSLYDADGLQSSKLLRDILAKVDAERFSV